MNMQHVRRRMSAARP